MIKQSDISSLYPFKSNFFKLKGHQYHYLDEGAGDAPVVMIHGSFTWSFMYRNLAREISQTRRVIVPDHLGCGLSDKPQDFKYRLETHIDNLEALLFSLKLQNITLVMHGWGGAIGMGFGVRHPQLISKVVILNSSAFPMEWLPFRLMLCRIPWLDEKLVAATNIFIRASTCMTVVKRMAALVKKGYLYPYQTAEDRIALLRFLQDIPLDPQHISFEVILEIEHGLWMFRETPVAIVWGMRDWYFSQRFLRRWQMCYPQAEVLKLDNAGNNLLEDAHKEAMPFIKNFINK